MKKHLAQLLALGALAAATGLAAPAQAAEPLPLLSTTPLPDVTGGDFGHFDAGAGAAGLKIVDTSRRARRPWPARRGPLYSKSQVRSLAV